MIVRFTGSSGDENRKATFPSSIGKVAFAFRFGRRASTEELLR
jgi:hypothetical protein